MSPPWMPFYPRDYIADTRALSLLEHGVYLLLILAYWQREGLPDDDVQLAEIVRLPLDEWLEVRPTIAEFFHSGWRHKRIDRELERANAAYRRRVEYFQQLDARRPDPATWADTRSRIFARDRFTCAYCGQVGGNLECDHIHSIARGGSNDDENLVTACRTCNRAKGALSIEEWRASLT